MVGATGIEPVSPTMSTSCSPAELRAQRQRFLGKITNGCKAFGATTRRFGADQLRFSRGLYELSTKARIQGLGRSGRKRWRRSSRRPPSGAG